MHTVHHDAETQLARIGPLGNSAAYINNCTADYHYIYTEERMTLVHGKSKHRSGAVYSDTKYRVSDQRLVNTASRTFIGAG